MLRYLGFSRKLRRICKILTYSVGLQSAALDLISYQLQRRASGRCFVNRGARQDDGEPFCC